MIRVKRMTAPVGVGVVGIGRQLQQDLRLLARLRGTNNKKESRDCFPAVAINISATTVADDQLGFVVTTLPIIGDGQFKTTRPATAMGRGTVRNRMLGN